MLLAFMLCCMAAAQKKDIPVNAPAIGYKWYPRYVTFLPYHQLDSVLAYAETDIVPVIYSVNKYELIPNAQTDSIADLLDRIIIDPRIKLAYVWIGGSASPEGPADWNMELGEFRARALGDWLLDNTSLPGSSLRIENLGEDWNSVARILSEKDFPNREEILRIISDESDNNERKRLIRELDGGRTWTKMIHELFTPLRNSRLVIVCNSELLTKMSVAHPSAPRPYSSPEFAPGKREIKLPPEYRFISLKTNALFLGALTANLGFEVGLWRKWSLDVPVFYSPYDITPTRKLRLLATQPEIRFWPKKGGEGHFIGLHTHVAGFNVAINDNGRYQDPNHALWGMGISYGYAINLGAEKRWSIEFNIGAGFAEYDYDIYRNWENGPKVGSGSDWYWGITRAGISISYKWYVEKKNGRGI